MLRGSATEQAATEQARAAGFPLTIAMGRLSRPYAHPVLREGSDFLAMAPPLLPFPGLLIYLTGASRPKSLPRVRISTTTPPRGRGGRDWSADRLVGAPRTVVTSPTKLSIRRRHALEQRISIR
ncbi:hypothetical protein GCM10023318_26620 [Nocardia callitridis]|uniref:Uncharacterized protein n=1 Tax=Nocardia callitridis TaxID=648753 RepID=A0ABP9KA72_9NOCA